MQKNEGGGGGSFKQSFPTTGAGPVEVEPVQGEPKHRNKSVFSNFYIWGILLCREPSYL
jgi:hypothetical protein